MNAKCGSCGKKHDTIQEYRDCAGAAEEAASASSVLDELAGSERVINPPSEKQIKYVMDLLAERVWPDEYTPEALGSMERRQVSQLINALQSAPLRPQDKVGAKGPEQHPEVPNGRYALKWESIKNQGWLFYQVKKGHTRIFVDLLIGSPGDYSKRSLSRKDVTTVLEEIERITPRQASIDFGLQSGTCGICSSPLTNEESLALGIGPKCRTKMGW